MKTQIDVLNRQPFIDRILSILLVLSNEKKGMSFAIDGEWGSGKTFLLEQLEKQIEPEQNEETFDDRYYLFHYNCWQYDYYDEPAVAIISAMLEKSYAMDESKIGKTVAASWSVVREKITTIANEFLKNKIGVDFVEIVNDFQNAMEEQQLDNSSFDKWFAFKKTLDETRASIQEIALQKTIVIIIDELDRCLPDYTIKVLERIHHIFDGIDNVVVIYAIDKKQLQHSVESIFGNKDDKTVERYLRKFISFELNLDYGNIQDSIWDKYSDYFSLFTSKIFTCEDATKTIITNLFKYSHIGIRNQEKIIERAHTIHKLICSETDVDSSILIFEIIISLFTYMAPGTDLKVIPEINRTKYGNLDEHIGKDFLNYLKELENDTAGNKRLTGNITYGDIECNKTINLTFYYFYSIFSEETKFAGDRVKDSKKGLDICKKFNEMRLLLQ